MELKSLSSEFMSKFTSEKDAKPLILKYISTGYMSKLHQKNLLEGLIMVHKGPGTLISFTDIRKPGVNQSSGKGLKHIFLIGIHCAALTMNLIAHWWIVFCSIWRTWQ